MSPLRNTRHTLRRMWASPIERALLFALALIVVSMLSIAALLATSRGQRNQSYCEERVTSCAAACAVGVQRTLDPVTERLQLLSAYGTNGILQPCDTDQVHRILRPLLAPLDHVDQLVVADRAGCGTAARRDSERWILEPASSFQSHCAVYRHWLDDPGRDASLLEWREVQSDSDDDRAAITEAIAWLSPNAANPDAFATATMPVSALHAAVLSWPVGESGQVVIVGDGDELVLLSPTFSNGIDVIRRDRLSHRKDLAFSVGPDVLRQPGLPAALPPVNRVRTTAGWFWCAFTATTLGDRQVWVGLALPEDELLEASRGKETVLLVVLLSMLLLGLGLAFFAVQHYRRRVQHLTAGPANSTLDESSLSELIRGGENESVEFKSTLRWNLRRDQADKVISLACLKTIAAFMNSDGGTLLIGVEDDGTILGMEADRFDNEDKYLLHFNNLIKQYIGLQHAGMITFALREIDGKRILVVDCARSDAPVFVKDDADESFYVRVGPGSRKLPTSEVIGYLNARQGG